MHRLLKNDLEEVNQYFPKLKYCTKGEDRFLKGKLDICDIKGVYWDTFEIGIVIPKKYPFDIPLLFELSKKIHRKVYRHVSKEGLCCVDIDHELLYLARRGIKLIDLGQVKFMGRSLSLLLK